MAAVALGLFAGSAGAAEPSPTAAETAILERLEALSSELRLLRLEVQRLRASVVARRRDDGAPGPQAAPAAESVSIAVADDELSRGDPQARLVMLEYSDFECPFCARFKQQTLPRIVERYVDTGKLRYLFRDFPLDFHAAARDAAVAAHCAGRQDAFWPMHERLFANQSRLGAPLYREAIKELGLDQGAFDQCLTDASVRKRVEANVASGESLGVRGTPTFFIGRLEDGAMVDVRRISGAQPFTAFAAVIDSLLK